MQPGASRRPFTEPVLAMVQGEFRAPTLRHIRYTGPYMHDGSLGSLDAVIDFYALGGGVGAVALHPLTLTAKERGELLAFLESL